MPERENLYFIALIPQKEVYDAIIDLKNDFADRFNSRRALRVMPHITLKAPFKLPISEHSKLVSWFQNLSLQLSKFQIELKDFGSFSNRNNPVVFVQPVMNESFFALQKEIIRDLENSFPGLIDPHDLKFSPHITIAYRDLSFENYKQAWQEYRNKNYNAIFEVDSVHLLQHDGQKWNIIQSYCLQ